jgi:O-antigen ligase
MVSPAAAPRPGSRPTRSPRARSARSNPLVAWVLVVGLGVVTLVGIGAGKGEALKYLYPAAALAVGLVLYRGHPEFYLGFVWWLWFVTPLVRRLVDYREGYDPLNPVLLAPVVVTALSLVSVLRYLPRLKQRSLVALFPIIASLIYAYPIGLQTTGVGAATYSFLQWIVPVAFGFHLATDPSRYTGYRATTHRVFIWAAFGLGLYGVWQFIDPPAWDRYWMFNTDMITIGQPVPFEVRVFSTVNSPTPFAMVMLAGLLMLLESRTVVHVVIGLPAYLAFLLSLVRTAWGGWVIGVGTYATYLGPRARFRISAMMVLLALGVGFLTASPLGERVQRRFVTFGNLAEDRSLAQRDASFEDIVGLIRDEPLGRGLGATGSAKRLAIGGTATFDNGLLNIFFSLGWAGGLLYLGGTLVLLGGVLRRFEPRSDPIPKVARAVGFATLAALASLNTLVGVSGVIFWGFLGLSISARTWYRAGAPSAVELAEARAPGAPGLAHAGR